MKALPIPSVSVIIVNYNAGEWLARCVASVAAQTHADFECFIVDNGSTDGSLETLPKLDARFTILRMGENLGFAAGNNRAAEVATGQWLALLNPDAFARPDWLEQGLAATSLAPNVAMVGSTQILALEPDLFDGLGDEYHAFGIAWRAGYRRPVGPIQTRESFGPCGAGAFYDAQVFAELGGFDEAFFCYHEDVDIAYRMRLAGYICVQSADAVIDHISSGVSGLASDFAVFHGTRNRTWTFFKNTPGPLLVLLTLPHVASCAALLFWSSVRSKRFKPTWRGTVAGFTRRGWTKSQRVKRRVPLLTLARAMAWNPNTVRRRDPVKTKPLKNEQP